MGNSAPSGKSPKSPPSPADEPHECQPRIYNILVLGRSAVGKTTVTKLVIDTLEEAIGHYDGDKAKELNENLLEIRFERLPNDPDKPHISRCQLVGDIRKVGKTPLFVSFEEVSGMESAPADGQKLPAPFDRIRQPPYDDYWVVWGDGDTEDYNQLKLWRNAVANTCVPPYENNTAKVTLTAFANRCLDPEGQKASISYSEMEKAKGLWKVSGFIPVASGVSTDALYNFVLDLIMSRLVARFPEPPPPGGNLVMK